MPDVGETCCCSGAESYVNSQDLVLLASSVSIATTDSLMLQIQLAKNVALTFSLLNTTYSLTFVCLPPLQFEALTTIVECAKGRAGQGRTVQGRAAA